MTEDAALQNVETFFAEDGPAGRVLEGYRPRPQQIAMAKAISRAIRASNHVIVEAGTGVGKSFGYLVPALLDALTHGKRVLVSTQTLSLQDQLIQKDIPRLIEASGLDLNACVAKGRANYLAPRRLEYAQARVEGERGKEELAAELRRLSSEIKRTKEGTRQEILPAPLYEAWNLARSERHDCLGQECAHFADDCHFHKARRSVFAADLIVVNHSLFFSDLILRSEGAAVLPDYDVAIFDEAHGLESVALSHLGAGVSRKEILGALSGVFAPSRRKGVLMRTGSSELARALVSECARETERFFEEAAAFAGRDDTREFAIDPFTEFSPRTTLARLAAELEMLSQKAEKKGLRGELAYHASRISDVKSKLVRALDHVDEDQVHWVEQRRRGEEISVEMRPLEIGSALRKTLFDRVGTVVMTSATLSVGRSGGLDWIAKRLGVPEAKTVQLGSPFDFRNQVRLRVPTWLNEPSDSDDWLDRAAQASLDYIERAQGGAFVLFTSYRQMEAIRRRIVPRLQQLGLPLLVQGGELSRAVMLDRFREDERSVLLGTDSFWQGVDIKGEGLRLVIITRLPFPVPSLPLNRARARRIEAAGGKPFFELSLPEAIVRFKQGFGRLIRAEDDTGTVVVLDTRILTKRYGKSFIDALPPVPLLED